MCVIVKSLIMTFSTQEPSWGDGHISIDFDELWHYKDSQFHNGMTIAHTGLSFQTDMPQGGAPAVISWFWHLLIIDNLPTPAIRVDKPI
jgi:hypothetical protein